MSNRGSNILWFAKLNKNKNVKRVSGIDREVVLYYKNVPTKENIKIHATMYLVQPCWLIEIEIVLFLWRGPFLYYDCKDAGFGIYDAFKSAIKV